MSLSSILSGYGFHGTRTSARTDTAESAAISKLPTTKGNASAVPAGSQANGGTGVVISAQARQAAANKADNAKDFGALSTEVRATLDAHYKASGATTLPDLSGMTGRAVAAIALNGTGTFSKAEVAAAKQELGGRTRREFASAMGSGGGIVGLAAYGKQMISDYDGMSNEERQARGWTDRFRASNATFVSKASAPNLFDQL